MPLINRIVRLSAATVALLGAASLIGASAIAQPAAYTPPPGAAPPWAGTSTTTTTTKTTKTDTSPAAIPALPTAQPQPTDTAATPLEGTTTPTHAVFLHSAPIAGSPVIGTVRPGTALHVLATANPGWIQVETPAGTGWAWGSYLAPASSPTPQ